MRGILILRRHFLYGPTTHNLVTPPYSAMSINQLFDGRDHPHYHRDSNGNQLMGPGEEGFGVLVSAKKLHQKWDREMSATHYFADGTTMVLPLGWKDDDHPLGGLPAHHQPQMKPSGPSAAQFYASDISDSGSDTEDTGAIQSEARVLVIRRGNEGDESCVTFPCERVNDDDLTPDFEVALTHLRTLPETEVMAVSQNGYDLERSPYGAAIFSCSLQVFRGWLGIDSDVQKPRFRTCPDGTYTYVRSESLQELGRWTDITFVDCPSLRDIVQII